MQIGIASKVYRGERAALYAALLCQSFSSVTAACVPAETESRSRSESRSGTFSVLTYNVAGLPQGVSESQPLRNMPLISSRLNDFDLVLTQEDFYYAKALRRDATHRYYAPRSFDGLLGDGLSRFSRFPMSEVDHQAWKSCHGFRRHASDCLTPKGFSFARHILSSFVMVDVYDLHADAGNSAGDQEARAKQIDQLIHYVVEHSHGQAVIIAGDTNLSHRRPRDMATMQRLLQLGFTDACRSLSCGKERIDRILFRGSTQISLQATRYQVEVQRFSINGVPLSDHQAISVAFRWQTR